ncbi:MAG: hypothetical protein ACWGSQ_06265 [Longimicrobiales bacterium]
MNSAAWRLQAILTLTALALPACDRSGEVGEGSRLPVEQWAADTATLEGARALVDQVGASVLFDRVSLPSPYLTDFFGVQILRPLTPEEVRRDLVPLYAEIAGETPFALTLRFDAGPVVVFRFNTLLYLETNELGVPYARVELSDPGAYPQQPTAFRQILVGAGLASRYLEPNPYFAAEQVAWDRMLEPELLESVPVRTDTLEFPEASHGVFLVGETHGGTEAFERAEAMVLSPTTDWLALEMFPEDLQPLLDRYLASADGSEGLQDARDALLRFYSRNWNTRGHEVTADPADNPYFRLIELARTSGKHVFALDTSDLYVAFRFGEFPLGASTRDYVWASKIPEWGRGVVYGGSSHFSPDRRPNMLTFLRERFPDIEIFAAPRGG